VETVVHPVTLGYSVRSSGNASAFPEIRSHDFPSSGVVSRGPGSAPAAAIRPRQSIAGSDSRSYPARSAGDLSLT
jgi:hypothetical protein